MTDSSSSSDENLDEDGFSISDVMEGYEDQLQLQTKKRKTPHPKLTKTRMMKMLV